MTREEEIKQAWKDYCADGEIGTPLGAFEYAIQWADNHPKSPWISVKERLPEEGLPLVVINKSEIRYYCYYNASIEKFVTLDPNGELWNVCEVTHWMPIPKLPKGE